MIPYIMKKKKVWYWMCFVSEKKMSHSNHVGFARHMQTAQKFKQTIEIIAFVYNFSIRIVARYVQYMYSGNC
jgi:hypothetical protein